MTTPSVSLGYVILYVEDVASSLEFYENAFGLERRFFTEEGEKAYGELHTGAACLAFASMGSAREHIGGEIVTAAQDKPPLAFEVALVTDDVAALYDRAVKTGAKSVKEPETKPWGQTVAYVRDPVTNGMEVQILDSHGKPDDKLSHHDNGGIIRTAPATTNASKPAGEWNQLKVTAKGNKVKVELNGKLVQDIDLSKTDSKDKPKKGRIGLQDHGQEISFRNFKVKSLDK